ncbi:MAG TPA: hypothetical protein VFD36_16210, partial [Kofleriaceae bacterium]|nr:hypothetical protein [Kofleriaceae bacterium]
MHLVDEHDAVPVRSTNDLLSYFESAGKPATAWRVGTEHELVGVVAGPWGPDVGEPPPYDGSNGIGALFRWFAARGEPAEQRADAVR